MTCQNCERYKQSAAMWRNKAYELGGTPLPWKADELWIGLTSEEVDDLIEATDLSGAYYYDDMYRLAGKIEAKLKEKNI